MSATVTAREAAAILDVRMDEIYRLLKTGKLGGRKVSIGRNATEWIIPRDKVEDHKKGMRKKRAYRSSGERRG